jgi:hypothetical protein
LWAILKKCKVWELLPYFFTTTMMGGQRCGWNYLAYSSLVFWCFLWCPPSSCLIYWFGINCTTCFCGLPTIHFSTCFKLDLFGKIHASSNSISCWKCYFPFFICDSFENSEKWRCFGETFYPPSLLKCTFN